MDKENENNASVEGITTAVFCREGDLKQFTDVFARLGRSCTAAQKGGIDEAQAWLTQHDAPGLLIVDISASPFPVPALADLAALAGPGCRIVAVGAEENVELYRSLLSAGAFDYLVSPVADALVVELLNRADSDRWLGMPDASSVRVGQTIAVTGAAGGAGTSTVAALLGRWIAEAAKYPTLLVDFDRRKGDLALLLGLKADNGLAGILSAAEIDYRLIARTVLADGEKKRLSLLAQRPGPETPVDPQLLLQLGGALCELFSVSIWDIPSHRPAGSAEILKNADVCVILIDYTVSNARAAKILLAELGAPQPGQRRFLVANHCRAGAGKRSKPVLTREEFENFLGVKVDFELPNAGTVLDASLLQGALTSQAAPAFARSIEGLACGLLGRAGAHSTTPGFAERYFPTVMKLLKLLKLTGSKDSAKAAAADLKKRDRLENSEDARWYSSTHSGRCPCAAPSPRSSAGWDCPRHCAARRRAAAGSDAEPAVVCCRLERWECSRAPPRHAFHAAECCCGTSGSGTGFGGTCPRAPHDSRSSVCAD